MRILITGATGQVGQALAQTLKPLASLHLATRGELDLSKPRSLPPVVNEIKPDLIINAAAYTAVDKAEAEKDLAFAINAEAVDVLGRWAAVNGVPIIHFSTDYVFDGRASEPYSETHPTNPLSVYGRSKAEGETLLLRSGACCLIIRTSWVYSPVGRNFLTTILRLASEQDELSIVDDQIGAPTSAMQIAQFVERLLRERPVSLRDMFQRSSRLVHFTAAGWTSWHGFACAIIARAEGRGVPLRASSVKAISSADFKAVAKRPQFSRLSIHRLQTVFDVRSASWEVR